MFEKDLVSRTPSISNLSRMANRSISNALHFATDMPFCGFEYNRLIIKDYGLFGFLREGNALYHFISLTSGILHNLHDRWGKILRYPRLQFDGSRHQRVGAIEG